MKPQHNIQFIKDLLNLKIIFEKKNNVLKSNDLKILKFVVIKIFNLYEQKYSINNIFKKKIHLCN